MAGPFISGLLADKRAVVTGAGSGIGQAIAIALGRQGAHILLIGRTSAKLAETSTQVAAAGGTAEIAAIDVRDYDAIDRAIAQFAKSAPIDILVNSAAGNFPAAASALTSNGFKTVLDINALGAFNTARAAYAHFRKPGGCIINLSAVQSFAPVPSQIHANAAKAALDQITRTLAIEWGQDGIRVNSIAPGPVADTEGVRRLFPDEAKSAATIPLRRFARLSEIADLAIFLCLPSAANISGAVIVTDGGQSLVGYTVLKA